MNTYELKKAWHRLVLNRETNERNATTKGGGLQNTVFEVLCLIGFKPRITIAKIEQHPYFYDTSLSTAKRAITTLLDAGIKLAEVIAERDMLANENENFANFLEADYSQNDIDNTSNAIHSIYRLAIYTKKVNR